MAMERSSVAVEEELERRSKFLKSLIEKKKKIINNNNETTEEKEVQDQDDVAVEMMVRVRASDMATAVQSHAFRFARAQLDAKLGSKRIALALKKEFDTAYGPAWHCIVGRSFGSYVTHSVGGFLYFSIDTLYILLFKTAVEPLEHH